ncbi:RNA-binding protein RRM domain containing protein [Nitzschia inconspicua]|uniref:RNA-binding protein RRM domain containing protein n=1 Tax=Nitzschia inconspicua TaxID=303405 RepID=A0A9K3PY32_9STRA|nr:RNA-binding protein RRM domain containing protein [Nitzschia inconspicua]
MPGSSLEIGDCWLVEVEVVYPGEVISFGCGGGLLNEGGDPFNRTREKFWNGLVLAGEEPGGARVTAGVNAFLGARQTRAGFASEILWKSLSIGGAVELSESLHLRLIVASQEMDSKTEDTMASSNHATDTAKANPSESEKQPDDFPSIEASSPVDPTGSKPSTSQPLSSDDTSLQTNDDRKRRVYVGNLAWSVSWQDLKDLMKGTGHEVTRADIMTTPDGRSKGCGIVEFATPEGAAEAVATLNDVELNGRQIFVREDREERGGGVSSSGPRNDQFHRRSGYQQHHRGSHYGQHSHGSRGGSGSNNASSRISSDVQSQSRRVYVGNLSWDVTWQELKEHMRSAGEVVFAEIITEHNGRSKGCGIVRYATEAEAQQAISTLAHTELKGRTIFVREDREGSTGNAGGSSGGAGRSPNFSGSGNSSVYVWNLSYDTSWQDLKDHMRKAGNVDQATILTDANDGSSIGCGVVVYQKTQDAQRAIRELQDSELNGRPLKLREDRGSGGSAKGGGRFGGRSGRFGGRSGGRHVGRGGGHEHPQQNSAGSGSVDNAPEGTQLFVSNLPFDATWKDLKDHFSTAGEVHRALIKVSDTGRSKGFGIVRFFKKEDAENAIATLNGVEFQGRPLDVRFDNKA